MKLRYFALALLIAGCGTNSQTPDMGGASQPDLADNGTGDMASLPPDMASLPPDMATPPDLMPAEGADMTPSPFNGGMMIGQMGGTLTTQNGTTIQFPVGAIDANTMITVTESAMAPPANSGAVTPVLDFGPAGTVFAHPVKIVFPLPTNAGSNLTVYWTKSDGSGTFEPIGGTIVGSTMVVEVLHFSSGFVGTDPGTRTITGTRQNTWVSGNTIKIVPRNSSTIPIEALVPNGDGTFTSYPGTGKTDGTFSIPNVPTGVVYVHAALAWEVTASNTIEINATMLGRTDQVTAQDTSSLAFNVDMMSPWQLGDGFELDCVQNDTWSSFLDQSPSVTGLPMNGDVALTNFIAPETTDTLYNTNGGAAALIEGTKGDRCTLAHMRYQQTADAVTQGYVSRIESFDPPAFTQTDGAQTTLTGSFVPTASPTTASVDFRASQFATQLATTGETADPTQILFYVIASPPLANHAGNNANLMYMDTQTLNDVLGTNMQYGMATQGPWEAWVLAQAYRTVTVTAPGATTGAQIYEGVTTAFEASALSTTSTPTLVTPKLGQLQQPKINGNDLLQPQTGVTTTPTLTWTAPALGTPDQYMIYVYEIDLDNGGTDITQVARFSTTGTTITIPPGLLATGVSYMFFMQAQKDNTPGAPVDPTTVPFIAPRDYDTATLASALVTP